MASALVEKNLDSFGRCDLRVLARCKSLLVGDEIEIADKYGWAN